MFGGIRVGLAGINLVHCIRVPPVSFRRGEEVVFNPVGEVGADFEHVERVDEGFSSRGDDSAN